MNAKKRHAWWLALFFGCVTVAAQEPLSTPLASLPADIPVQKGSVSLHAHVGSPDDEAIALYLINDTNQDADFPLTDNDTLLKREALVPPKDWRRTEPFTRTDVDCITPPPASGNRIKYLPAKHFVVWWVIFNDPGDFPKHKVRYRFVNDRWGKLKSNEVEARIDPFWFEWCARDALAIMTAPTDVLCDVALNGMPKLPGHIRKRIKKDEFSLYGGWPENAQRSACGELASRSWESSAPTLWKIAQTHPTESRVRETAIHALSAEGNLLHTAEWLTDPARGASKGMQQSLLEAMNRPASFKQQKWPESFRSFLESRLSDPNHMPTAAEVTLYAVGSPMKKSVQRLQEIFNADQNPERRKVFAMVLKSEPVLSGLK
ncbi:hypothetical protein [Roseimicrobium sp. ORNL1]|uniref:hypothetical protein n=1 Tax=Roseimicrobium sp. ORNL1 TaxID=2711231 RepID=UPI0013E11259|nr:hypothetical protein [Roseimicrobium sp. ORNL1]QIF00556.1 hypothetical protein G5S37_03145 [Roseimicrobium sp. ORNL1]